jgi:AcrR family transcriptional regulator
MKDNKNNTKEKLLSTAFYLFITKGYRVGISAIVKAAGVSKGALYHHFHNKDELFEASVKKYFINETVNYGIVDSAELDIKEKIDRIVYLYFIKILNKNGSNRFPSNLKSNFLHILVEYSQRPLIKKTYLEELTKVQHAFRDLLSIEGLKSNKKINLYAQILTDMLKGHLIDLMIENPVKQSMVTANLKNKLQANIELMIQ